MIDVCGVSQRHANTEFTIDACGVSQRHANTEFTINVCGVSQRHRTARVMQLLSNCAQCTWRDVHIRMIMNQEAPSRSHIILITHVFRLRPYESRTGGGLVTSATSFLPYLGPAPAGLDTHCVSRYCYSGPSFVGAAMKYDRLCGTAPRV